MMEILCWVNELNLPDWWICAGFVRSKIWDTIHRYESRTAIPDIDVVYFDPLIIDEYQEKKWEERLLNRSPDIPWSVKNEARMHLVNGIPPYTSSVDAISKFPETATALGLKLDENEQLLLAAQHGIEDAIHLQLKPTPYIKQRPDMYKIYKERVMKKNWKSIWPLINVHDD
nr:nucleotidyltransferase family protein [Bacillus pakistanensis]